MATQYGIVQSVTILLDPDPAVGVRYGLTLGSNRASINTMTASEKGASGAAQDADAATTATAAAPMPYDALSPLAAPSVSHAVVDKRDVALITLTPSQGVGVGEKAPVDVVCVVDLSISMDDPATLASDTSSEGTGLTILDIVKHAVKTVIASLGNDDRLAIVSFSDKADIELPLTSMGTTGKEAANLTLGRMRTTGSTNIWAGIDQALDVIQANGAKDSRLTAVLLFTDGQPNIRPPAGEPAMLVKRINQKFGGTLPCIVNTFGFGYNLDSLVLHQLARIGNGSFAFIPDASFVGTVFVDATANILAAMAKSIVITLEPLNGAEISLTKPFSAIGGHEGKPDASATPDDSSTALLQSFSSLAIGTPLTIATGQKVSFQFGSMQAVQSKDLAVHLSKLPAPSQPYLRVTASYHNVRMAKGVADGPLTTAPTVVESVASARNTNAAEVAVQLHRLLAVERIRDGMALAGKDKFEEAQKGVAELVERIRKVVMPKVGNDRRLEALVLDLEGQVTEAFEEKYFNRWGKHYLLSLSGAHLMQQCNNFKDPGVQVYKGPLFETIRDELNELFLTLPPPVPTGRRPGFAPLQRSVRGSASSFRSAAAPAAPAPINMSRYYDASAPCFAGSTRVLMADGTRKPIAALRRYDLVATVPRSPGTPYGVGTVRAVLRTSCPTTLPRDLVRLRGDVLVTPWHPVRRCGASDWEFPASHATTARERAAVDVFSVLLERDGIGARPCGFVVGEKGDWEGVALAHGIDGAVCGHAFFGGEEVVRAMERMRGWEDADGLLECVGVVRDAVSRTVCGLVGEWPPREETWMEKEVGYRWDTQRGEV
ncbi:hypothetical protein HDU96_009523 [Phlyctochytrium bullatum]|nr:hypothetical protein HDU96_009523 [Phlyctochytrium bullatum]